MKCRTRLSSIPGKSPAEANPFARSPAINSLFNRCYGSDILPSRPSIPAAFSMKTFCQLLPVRPAVGRRGRFCALRAAPERHEQYLDDLFWNRELEHPLVCVLGPVGLGKIDSGRLLLALLWPDQRAESRRVRQEPGRPLRFQGDSG